LSWHRFAIGKVCADDFGDIPIGEEIGATGARSTELTTNKIIYAIRGWLY